MPACSAQALSQVGCRLMVASSAKISRPRAPAAVAGPSVLTRSRNAPISGRVEAGAGAHLGAVEDLHPQALRVGIAAVAGGAAAFGL